MSMLECLADNCPIERVCTFSDIRHNCLRTAFNSMPLSDFFVCQEHGSFHLCKNGMEREDCITDEEDRCVISDRKTRKNYGIMLDTTVKTKKQQRWVRKMSERQRIEQVLTEKYTGYNFATCTKNMISEKCIDVCMKRLNSMIQRLYELFSQEKEEDGRKMHVNDNTRLDRCDERFKQLLTVLEQDLKHTRHHEPYFGHYSNSEPGAAFRTQVSFIVAHDLSCKEDALVPYTSAYEEPIYVSKYAQILARRSEHAGKPKHYRGTGKNQ